MGIELIDWLQKFIWEDVHAWAKGQNYYWGSQIVWMDSGWIMMCFILALLWSLIGLQYRRLKLQFNILMIIRELFYNSLT